MRKRCTCLFSFAVALLLFLVLPDLARAQIQEIRIADSKGDWGYPNPFRHYPRGPGYVRMSWVFDTLLWKDRKGYMPALADSWSYDPGRMAFTFNLNPRARWHDHQPLTAHDVVFTIEYFKKHAYSWISVDDVSRAEAAEPHKVIIYLSKPYSPFISDIGGTMPIMPKHIWQSVDNPEAYNDPKAFVGSGPYRFVDFNKAQGTYLYEAFGDYYQGRPKADRLIYIRSGQPLVSLTSRQVDLANIQPDMAEPLKQKGLGVNDGGMDIFSELLYGIRNTVLFGLLTGVTALVIGVAIGLVGAWFSGWTDHFLMRLADILLAVPAVMILILVAAFFRPSPLTLGLILAALSWPTTAKAIRAQALVVKKRLHVQAALQMGASGAYIIWRHLLPELFPLYLIGFTTKARMAMFMEASLSFLGLFDPSRKSLGMMISYALKYYYLDIWWNWLIPPILCLTLLIMTVTFLAVSLEKVFDPRLKEAW